jgi:hypothetical protein
MVLQERKMFSVRNVRADSSSSKMEPVKLALLANKENISHTVAKAGLTTSAVVALHAHPPKLL